MLIDSCMRPARAIADYPIGAFTFYPPPMDDAEH